MTWTSLVAPKGTAGSIMNWVNYSKLDQETVVNEAQSLIFETLRVREMRFEWTFGMAVGQANQALPTRFLDPIGRLYDITNGGSLSHKIESDIQAHRSYEPTSGTLGANPFTTTTGLSTANVFAPGHGLTQGSTSTFAGCAAPFDNLNATFPVVSITDASNFLIDFDLVSGGGTTGGGSAVTYTANKLISGYPSRWAIWDEQVKFDTAFDVATVFKQLYYRAPLPLSSSNQSNWLTNRYPMLMRKACLAAAADFMKDDTEYQKQVAALSALIGSTAASNDLIYRGAEFGTDTP